ncbi:MAG: hypothetical protein ABEK50_11005 [bacterium]
MTVSFTDQLEKTLEEIDRIQTRENLDADDAIQVAILAELRTIREKIEDIEVHTNNTVRKL